MSERMNRSTELQIMTEGRDAVRALAAEVQRSVTINQQDVWAMTGAIALGGAVILDGEPGTGKTVTAQAFANAMGGTFARHQGMPDSMPADILGTRIWNPAKAEFEFHRGKIFSNVFLADEINRNPPKTQAALLEAMSEKTVSVAGDKTYEMPDPHAVIATHNPREIAEGTYHLTKANIDRFMVGIEMKQDASDQLTVLLAEDGQKPAREVTNLSKLKALRGVLGNIVVDEALKGYIVGMTNAVLEHPHVDLSTTQLSGTRKNKQVMNLARFFAFGRSEEAATLDDAQAALPYVVHHRLGINEDAEEAGVTTAHIVNDVLSNWR